MRGLMKKVSLRVGWVLLSGVSSFKGVFSTHDSFLLTMANTISGMISYSSRLDVYRSWYGIGQVKIHIECGSVESIPNKCESLV